MIIFSFVYYRESGDLDWLPHPLCPPLLLRQGEGEGESFLKEGLCPSWTPLFLSFPPRIKYGVNSSGNPVINKFKYLIIRCFKQFFFPKLIIKLY
jgi:hypothetical protein